MKTVKILLSVLFLFCSWQISSQAVFSIVPADISEIISEPGRVITRVFFVSDTGSGEGVFDFDLKLPEGWKLITGKETLEVASGVREMTLVSFYIPESAPAGEYKLEYQAISTESNKVLDFNLIEVEVLPRSDFALELIDSPSYCVAGDTYRLTYQLRNKGNVQSNFYLKGFSQNQYTYSIDRRSIILVAGGVSKVQVFVETDPLLLNSINHLFQLEVILDNDEEKKEEIASLTEVLPRITGKEETYNTIPAELTIEPVFEHGETDRFGVQAEIRGEGTLDAEGEKNMAFILKRPFNPESQLTPEREEFSIRLWSENWELFLGDGFYSLSDLTETSKYGRGVSGRVGIEKFNIDGYYLIEQDSVPLFEETAASVSYSPTYNSTYFINYLNKHYGTNTDLFSMEGHLHPRLRDVIDFEYASGGGIIHDDSYYFSLAGSHDQLSYRVKYLYAGPDFQGTFQDLDMLNSNLTYLVNDSFSISAIYGRTQNHMIREFPSSKEYLQARMNWKINRDMSLQFHWSTLYHDDKLPVPENWFEQESMGVNFTRSLGNMKLSAILDLGFIDDFKESRKLLIEKYGLSLNAAVAEKHDLFSSLTFNRNEKDGFDNIFYTFDLKWKFRILPTTDMFANFKTVNYPGSYHSGSDSFDIGFSHLFENESSLSFNGSYSPPRSSEAIRAFTLNLKFSTPLNIPISRKQHMERLEGYVKYLQTGEPLSNVILRVGSSVAVTDTYGRFVFHSLPPGGYKLFLDPSSLDDNLITTETFPIEVSVEKDGVNNLDVDVVESSTIQGQLNVYELEPTFGAYSGEDAKYQEPYGLSDALIEIRKGDERYRVLTDSKGRFYMSRIRPGTWQIVVDDSVLPENHYFEKNDISVELEIEEIESVEIKILPRIRPVIFIDEGVIEEVIEVEEQ